MLQGDISNFSPADLLTFLAHLNKEGALTVSRPGECLSFGFRGGQLTSAHSDALDQWVLDKLRHRDAMDAETLRRMEQARRETGLPLFQILDQIEGITVDAAAGAMNTGMREAVFQLFLWESGEFQFLEMAVDENRFVEASDCQALAMDVAREVDEYREALRSLGPVDHALVLTPLGCETDGGTDIAVYVRDHAHGDRCLGELLSHAPFRARDVAMAVAEARKQGLIELVPREGDAGTEAPDTSFQGFRRALRGMHGATDLLARIRVLEGYCRDQCDVTLLLALRGGGVDMCKSYQRDAQGKTQVRDLKAPGVFLDSDPVIERAVGSHRPFYGRVFASDFLRALQVEPPDGDCAIVPLGELDGRQLVVYAATAATGEGPGPLHYLELLGWHIQPPTAASDRPAEPIASAAPPLPEPTEIAAAPLPEPANRTEVQKMVASIRELPAMPDVVTGVLRQLAKPDWTIAELEAIISRDQALVARMIKVSNSVLYGGDQKFRTLSQALVRMGYRTIRSLVVAASARALFPMNDTQVGLWGRALWDHSSECGVASRLVAEAVGYPDPEEAFAAGIMHDIGKAVILLNLPDEYRRMIKLMERDNLDSRTAEERVLGFDHCQLAGWLTERWSLPPELVAGMVCHHDPQSAGECERLARIVACGNTMSHQQGLVARGFSDADSEQLQGDLEALGLEFDAIESLEDRIQVSLVGHKEWA